MAAADTESGIDAIVSLIDYGMVNVLALKALLAFFLTR